MKIRHKILTYISTAVIPAIALAFVFIYVMFYEYREEEFQQQQFKKIKTTVRQIEQFKDQSAELSHLLDQQDIHDFYDEKLHIFDADKNEIFASLDDLIIEDINTILAQLSPNKTWIETKENDYDLIGVYIERQDNVYYGISKAYDEYGHTKLDFLRNVLIATFLLISLVIVLVSIYIARMISRPITELESTIINYDLNEEFYEPISLKTSTSELNNLTDRFNDLLQHTQEAFKFQKHTTNHISHQLKTPIAVLVTELERIEAKVEESEVQEEVKQLKIQAKSLGNIINVLLEISKIEVGQTIDKQLKRVDELIFDCISELNIIYPNFNFEVNYYPDDMEEEDLQINFNATLLKQAFINLLTNSVTYSTKDNAEVVFYAKSKDHLQLRFINTGKSINEEEEKFLFRHFFRGENSSGKEGYGLGLILTKRILNIHEAEITYHRDKGQNIFEIDFIRTKQ